MRVLILDLETNGLSSRSSVLSVTAEKYLFVSPKFPMAEIGETGYVEHIGQLERIGRFHRFYYSREPENPEAIKINGLDRDTIREEREGKGWPQFFDEDYEFQEFCESVELVVGHNVTFDLQFCPFLTGKDWFCTMRAHTVKKFPSLRRLAERYSIPIEEGRLHQGEYDVALTREIFNRILQDLDVYVSLEKKGYPAKEIKQERRQEILSRLGF
jgi:DNA polymerase-3 subunit epsilon